MAFCTNCGTLLQEGSNVCGKCGTAVDGANIQKRCGFCGNIVEDGLNFCSYCGSDLSQMPKAEAVKDVEAPTQNQAENHTLVQNDPSFAGRSEPLTPGASLYKRSNVSIMNGIAATAGTLEITEKMISFKPWKIQIFSKPVSIPMSEVAGAPASKVYGAVSGGVQVKLKNGNSYNFAFGAVYTAEADKVIGIINNAVH